MQTLLLTLAVVLNVFGYGLLGDGHIDVPHSLELRDIEIPGDLEIG